jgi:hypothetical protein
VKIITSAYYREIPRVGDLIRSGWNPNFVNIVLNVSEPFNDSHGVFRYIRSVRYGTTNGGHWLWLNGRRSRSFKWYPGHPYMNDWVCVRLFGEYDDSTRRSAVLKSLEGVDTAYRKEEDEEIPVE